MDEQQPAPPPQIPERAQNSTTLTVVVALLIVATLGAGAYFLWSGGFFGSFMESRETMESEPSQAETADLEAELQSVELGADAELEALEAQF